LGGIMDIRKSINAANILSASRFVLLPVPIIFVLLDMRLAFVIAYIILGSTDFFDGIVARRFKMVSELGKKLDSFSDLFFYLASAWFLYSLHPEVITSMPNLVLIIIFLSMLVISFVVSGIKCKKPVLMHTFILKLNAVILYFAVIFAGVYKITSMKLFDMTFVITILASLYLIGMTEEMIIFIKYGDVDPDSESIFHIMRDRKQAKEAKASVDMPVKNDDDDNTNV
jgi:phosphatidylglycerophosphate synthase